MTSKKFEATALEYALLERDVLQDNIILVDAKSGFLLAFAGAAIVRCLDKVSELLAAHPNACPCLGNAVIGLYAAAVVGFLATLYFVWQVVRPRLKPHDDFIYWGSNKFKGTEKDFTDAVEATTDDTWGSDILRLLHVLAAICREKFKKFKLAAGLAEFSTLIFVIAEIARVFI